MNREDTVGFRGRMVRGTVGVLLVLSLGGGCNRLALEPGRHRLKAEWRLNGEERGTVSEGVPVVAEVRVRNLSRWPVRLPEGLVPRVDGSGDGLVWKPLRPLPATLPPAGEALGWWLLEGGIEVGSHEIGFDAEAPLSGLPAGLTVDNAEVSALAMIGHRATVARLTGRSADLARELVRENEGKEMLPTTRLLVADLFAESGESDEAAVEYERFAEEVYGVEGLPGWLQLRLRSVSNPGDPP